MSLSYCCQSSRSISRRAQQPKLLFSSMADVIEKVVVAVFSPRPHHRTVNRPLLEKSVTHNLKYHSGLANLRRFWFRVLLVLDRRLLSLSSPFSVLLMLALLRSTITGRVCHCILLNSVCTRGLLRHVGKKANETLVFDQSAVYGLDIIKLTGCIRPRSVFIAYG